MKISEIYRSKYLKASDLAGKTIPVQIRAVALEEIGKELEEKPVVYFKNSERGLVLNKTNAVLLATHFGDDPTGWTGRAVHLCSEPVYFQGEQRTGLRVKIPPGMDGEASVLQAKKVPAPVAADAGVDLDEDLPF